MNKSKSFTLFLLSVIIIGLTFLIATSWNLLGFGSNKIPLAILIIVSFGISLAGLILGVYKFKEVKSMKINIGLVGNALIILFFILMLIQAQ